MLKDFAKVNTFLTVVKEKSFSKASKKLGISQPAVTQQIKLLEAYLKHPIVNRKKNGIGLTKEGKEFYRIAQKLDRFLTNLEREVIQVIDKKITFTIGTSQTIGKYIMPNFIEEIKESIDNDIMIKIGSAEKIINNLLEKKVDIALVEECNFNSSVTFREWMDDELVVFSRYPLPATISKDKLQNYKWIIRNSDSAVHRGVIEKFEQVGINYSKFEVVSFVTSATTIKQSMMKSKPLKENEKQMIAFISKHTIKDEVANGELFMSKIRGIKFHKKLYLAYLKEFKNDAFLRRVTDYLMEKKKI